MATKANEKTTNRPRAASGAQRRTNLPPAAELLADRDRETWAELLARQRAFEDEWTGHFAALDPADELAHEELRETYIHASEELHEQLEPLFEEIQRKVDLAWIQRPRARAVLATLATLSDEQLDSEQLTRVLARELEMSEAEVEFELVMLVFHDTTTDVLAAQGLQRRAAIRSASRSIMTTDSEAGDRAT